MLFVVVVGIGVFECVGKGWCPSICPCTPIAGLSGEIQPFPCSECTGYMQHAMGHKNRQFLRKV